ncbi:LysM peptidoglycan-binding domain-containing protein [Bhargavaea ginsengi]|uniref:LysM peptidoglycan-binding and 3D domain-containing protein n=1 Tax=Bhargavaea ginsengi TaxID=426757 RepID=UPI00203B3D83|nr:LysM peptidoglycan-binding and 3D domain-containing protein [Bhargavaea ginsengi]MCM3086542.1 LysM peptidoglycan-binding domain-containing protein [Bhargavaea ginsengi]
MKKSLIALTAALTLGAGVGTASAAEHTVSKGDTLWSISQANSVTVAQLKQWNSLSSDLIRPGDVLTTSGGSKAAPAQTQQKASAAVKSAAAPASTYTVKSGDTLYRIATNHGMSVNTLMGLNGLSSSLIHPGQALKVSGKAVQASASNTASASKPAPSAARELSVRATAYTAYCNGCSGVTATGINLRANPNQKVIAVDPKVIPLGTEVWVEGYGEAIAGDTGGAIKGNRIDVFIPNKSRALQWGSKTVKVKVLN